MRRTIIILLLCVPALARADINPPEGRWEGSVEIPGRPLPMVVDLAQDGAGTWTGSIVVQGFGIKGAPLSNVLVANREVTFDLGTLLASRSGEPTGFKATLTATDGMAGEMRQGGNTARFALKRIASATVEVPARSTPVARELADRWAGEFELGGYPRQVTITLENHADAGATAQFVIVGKQTNDLPVDVVTEERGFLRIESLAAGIAFEGRLFREQGEIRGVVELGSMELPLVLRRATGRAS